MGAERWEKRRMEVFDMKCLSSSRRRNVMNWIRSWNIRERERERNEELGGLC